MECLFNYFYRIENLIDGKFYYGVHKTNNLEDGYMGSGLRIKRAIKKYGIENFKKDILDFFDTYEQALNFEESIVTEELLLNENCYNLKRGGTGGFEKQHYMKGAINGKHAQQELFKDKNSEFYINHIERCRKLFKRLHEEGKLPKYPNWTGKRHNEYTKRIIGEKNSVRQKGEGNSQYGTRWITNEKENKKIQKGESIPIGWKLGRKIKRDI